MIVYDNHLHLNYDNDFLNSVKRFVKEGGNFINICNLPKMDNPYNIEYFREQYEKTMKISKLVKENFNIHVLITIGPYPVDFIKSEEKLGFENAYDLFIKAIDLALEYIKDNKANALGEIGRPHFNVEKTIMDYSNKMLEYAMHEASKYKIPVILHTESATRELFAELSSIAERAGMEKMKVIKHFSPPFILEDENFGIFPSVISSRENVKEAMKKGTRFFLETDFLDDPSRPGAVLDITSVPRRYRMMENLDREFFKKYVEDVEENLKRIYGIMDL
ncbi:MAG: TatD family hydrolase [Thermoplasmata archaeon]